MLSGKSRKQQSYLREIWRLGFLIPLTYGKWRIQSLFSEFELSYMLLDSLGLNQAVGTLHALLCWVFKFIFLPPSPPHPRTPPMPLLEGRVNNATHCMFWKILPPTQYLYCTHISSFIVKKTISPCLWWVALERLYMQFLLESRASAGYSGLILRQEGRHLRSYYFISYFDILLTKSWWLTAIDTVGWPDSETAFKSVGLMLASLWNKVKYWP